MKKSNFHGIGILILAILHSNPLAAETLPHADNELLVKFRGGAQGPAAAEARQRMNHEVLSHFDFIGWQHIRLPAGMTVEEGLTIYHQMPGVLAAEPNYLQEGLAGSALPGTAQAGPMPSDPLRGDQWNLDFVSAPDAWALGTGTTDVVVAVLDTGVIYDHEDLAPNMWRNPGEIPDNGIDDDENGYIDDVYGVDTIRNNGDPQDFAIFLSNQTIYHGTGCAGIIGAVSNNGLGIAGLSQRARIMAIRCWAFNNTISVVDQVEAFDYLVMMKSRGVNIVATSCSWRRWLTPSQAREDAVAAAGAVGILNVFAAGNFGRDIDINPEYHSSYTLPSIISVAGTDQFSGDLVSFSNYGATTVDLAAPAVAVPTTYGPNLDDYSTTFTGTSAAAPHVAAGVALLASATELSAEEIKATLLQTVDLGPSYTNKMVSHGTLNLRRALETVVEAAPRFAVAPQDTSVGAGFPAQLDGTVVGTPPISLQWLKGGVALSDQTNASISFPEAAVQDAGVYVLVASNAFGVASSDPVLLDVVEEPLILTHPESQTIVENNDISFSVSVQSLEPISYQWFFNDSLLTNRTLDTLALQGVTFEERGDYHVVITNPSGATTSQVAVLTVLTRPQVIIPPLSQTAVVGDDVTFSIVSSGTLPLGLRWRHNSGTAAHVPESFSHTNFLVLTNVQTGDAGRYTVVLTNSAFMLPGVLSRNAFLTVLVDTDGDKMPDIWESEHGLNPNDPSDGAEDTDGDGQTNRKEYQAGTDPLDPQSYLKVESIELTNDGTSVLIQFLAISNRTYSLLYRSQPGSGVWQSLVDIPATATNRDVIVQDTIPGEQNRQRYYLITSPRKP